jgi:hypothetical protein
MRLATLPAANCLPSVVANATDKEGEHDSKIFESMARPKMNDTSHLRARKENESYAGYCKRTSENSPSRDSLACSTLAI